MEYPEKGETFLSIISESEIWNFDDYGLQIMKTQNSVSQN